MSEKARSGDLIKVTYAFNEPYNVGDILEVEARFLDIGENDNMSVLTTEGYCLLDSEYKIFKRKNDDTTINIEELQIYKENEELKSCLNWMYDCYKRTLGNEPVRNLDEVFAYTETLLKDYPQKQKGVNRYV